MWQADGEIWKAVSSWIVHARLKLASAGQHLPGGLHHSSYMFVLVVCLYAPNVPAPGDIVKHFYDNLQNILCSIPSFDLMLMLGNFNAHVRVQGRSSDLWSDV